MCDAFSPESKSKVCGVMSHDQWIVFHLALVQYLSLLAVCGVDAPSSCSVGAASSDSDSGIVMHQNACLVWQRDPFTGLFGFCLSDDRDFMFRPFPVIDDIANRMQAESTDVRFVARYAKNAIKRATKEVVRTARP